MLQKTSEEYRALIFGNTDTEHFAALYFTCLGDASKKYSAKQMQIALVKAMVIVNDLQREILGAEQENQLNFCASTSSQSRCNCPRKSKSFGSYSRWRESRGSSLDDHTIAYTSP